MAIDWTVHVSDVALVIGLIVAIVKMVIFQSRTNDRILSALGKKSPPDGLLGDVEGLKARTSQHHDWLVVIRGKNGS